MGRPEILTSAALAAAGLALALWLAANRPPHTPEPPGAPEALAALSPLASLPERDLPRMEAGAAPPDLALGANGLPCGPSLQVAPERAGVLWVTVTAPCRAGEAVEIVHGPLRFTERLSVRGALRATVPRLTREAGITARIGETFLKADAAVDGETAHVSGLVWSPPLELSLVALEFGAGQGDRGHLTAGVDSGAGRVLRLGEPALGVVTDLYIGPRTEGPGVVRLHVRARRTEAACGGEQPLVAFRTGSSGLAVRDIRLRLGPCDGAPETILLKNLLEDLKIAGR